MTSGSAPSSSPMTKARQLQALTYGKSQFYPPTLTNYNIGSSSNSDPEHASEVMYALASVEKEFRDSGKAAPVALSLCFSEASAPIPEDMNMFRKIFRRVAHSPSSMKILLLEKNKDFTSPSDWHDLQVVVMALGSTHTTKWLEDMQRVFFYHANRTAFTLLEPRAAIMESVYLESNAPHVGYFSEQDVCVLHKGTRASAASAALSHALCPAGQLSRVSVPLTCSCHRRTASPKASGHGCPCSRLFPPAAWIQRISVSPTGINDRVGQNVDKFLANLPEHNKYGTARFRFTNSSDMPQGYCWETGDAHYERKSQSRIYTNATYSVPFSHPFPASTASASVAIISASGGNAIDKAMDMALSRMYYAHRHGYKYQHLVSEEYTDYFGGAFLEKVKNMDNYPKNVMSKVVMIVSTMYLNMDKEWIMWMDDDTWINPGWMSMPLDVYLKDVPADKLIVLGNHRSAQSNVLFIRNNERGRQLGRDWLAIAMSGYVQCHGFDQGALEILIVSRLYENAHPNPDSANNIRTSVPYNFTCLQEKWVSETLPIFPFDFFTEVMGHDQPRDVKHPWGCDGGPDWSCDFKFEKVLREVGFLGVSSGFHMPLSSFSQGCANDYFPDFHVTAETAERPRLHVGFCSRLDEIQGTEFLYDGPVGGGNDYVRRFAVNGWMINHKADINYYEAYRDSHACKKSETFARLCNASLVESMIRNKIKKNDKLILLTGGYAYETQTKQYCSGGPSLLAFQKNETYMKFYPNVIAAAKKIEILDWHRRQDKSIYGEYQPIDKFNGKYFQPADYCELSCSEKSSVRHNGRNVLFCLRGKS
eukprot:CAMPEP_0114449916 /NCGR_PEP_ID=MMETSP0104-20121206/188_1 /TAXON_ID=37642 ORGANISM="Paraphysomonas imperforata, Strain PA2" /NCGR_SAMPLE_ID=MMETSP0104 /ASSEMBLY_ACC=CAM_ASM_000202 /LENGTH=817 /DNA_ID=CAMNT_0001622035 /DNA_START=328 /DNA_END=2781 /DNA_ORIENTATION=+